MHLRQELLRRPCRRHAAHPDDAIARDDIDRREVIADDAGQRREPHRVDLHHAARGSARRFLRDRRALRLAPGVGAGMASAGRRAGWPGLDEQTALAQIPEDAPDHRDGERDASPGEQDGEFRLAPVGILRT